MLARHARDLVLTHEPLEVAHRAQRLRRLLFAARSLLRIGLERGRARLLGGEKRGEVDHVLPRELRHERVHLRLLAAPLLEILELEIDVARRLAGEDREERDRRVAVRAVASEARLRLLAAGLYVLTPRRLSRDNRERRQRKLHGRPPQPEGSRGAALRGPERPL